MTQRFRGAFRSLSALFSVSMLVACGGDGPTGGQPGRDAPGISSVSPAVLVPGGTATISGTNFGATPGDNTVTIGGVAAPVTAATATQLQVAVPCALGGDVPVVVSVAGRSSSAFSHALQVGRRTLAVGQAAILTEPAEVACTELAPAGGAARYVVAVYSASGSAGSSTSFRFSGDGSGPATTALAGPSAARIAFGGAAPLALSVEQSALQRADEAHYALLEKNRVAHAQLSARFAGDPRMRPSASRSAAAPAPPAPARTFRVANANGGSFCSNYFTVSATRVYYQGRIAIYEDNANPISTSHAVLGATMQEYFTRIGDQFNADMEPIIRENFGDPLLRDAVTDNNGVMIALFTNTINTEMPSIAGFVVSCDQFPNDEGSGDTNTSSNFGEYFYAYVPTVEGQGYSTFTPDSWYRTIRSTFIHETKHVASHAARVANGAPYEASWLEEGTARHSEELWARQAVYGVAWKGNTGYGSASDPSSIYCDVRPTTAGCLNSSPLRPSVNMQRHFSSGALYEFMGNTAARSPFGRAEGDDGASFYATAWSLARYAIDRYGASDAAFLSGLTQSHAVGVSNLVAQAGVPLDRLLGGWALALYADDYPGLASASEDIRFPSWDIPDIYAGLKADFADSYPRPRHIVGESLAFGAFAPLTVPHLAGGGVKYFELSGNQTAAQLLRLEASAGGPASSTLRVAVARLQ